jgi:hypothetical protein
MIFDYDRVAEELFAQILTGVALDPACVGTTGVVRLPGSYAVWMMHATRTSRGSPIATIARPRQASDLEQVKKDLRKLARRLKASPRGREARRRLFGKRLPGRR